VAQKKQLLSRRRVSYFLFAVFMAQPLRPARGDLPQTYPCPVRSCRRTFMQQRDRDEHVVRVHPKTEEMKTARRHLDDLMRMALQRGSPSTRPQSSTGNAVKGLASKEETQSANVVQTVVEHAASVTKAKAGTTASWSPLGLETAAQTLVMKQGTRTDDCIAATPIADREDTRPVALFATRPRTRVSKVAWQFDRRRIWPRLRKKYSGRAVCSSAGVQKGTKRSSTR
jgi:hypothetical protein